VSAHVQLGLALFSRGHAPYLAGGLVGDASTQFIQAMSQREQNTQDGASKATAEDSERQQPPVVAEASLVEAREGQANCEGSS
jgi:hypothetical protein